MTTSLDLTEKQHDDIRAYAERIAKKWYLADPEGAAQDAHLEVWRAAAKATPQHANQWAKAVVRRVLARKVRSTINQRNGSKAVELQYRSLPVEESADPYLTLANTLGHQIAALIVEGYTLKEIADKTGTTEGAIKAKLQRAKNKFHVA